jgi:hypothetical protein
VKIVKHTKAERSRLPGQPDDVKGHPSGLHMILVDLQGEADAAELGLETNEDGYVVFYSAADKKGDREEEALAAVEATIAAHKTEPEPTVPDGTIL